METNYSERDLIKKAQSGDTDAAISLLEAYRGLVKSITRQYYIVGADTDDLIQEGMIGLLKAVRDYDHSKGSYFFNFARLCIRRQVITAIKTATRQKHIPLNNFKSLSSNVFEGVESRLLMDIIPSNICDPETEFIQKEQSNIFQEVFNTELSALERNAIALQLQGYAFNEIADLLSVHVKSVDNALWRAKKKLKQAINY